MTDPLNSAPLKSHEERIAGGAGLAFVGRMGALIEVASVIAFTWAYGAATFGLYAVLWSYIKVATGIAEAAMPTALQRYIPKAGADADNITGFALKISFFFGCIIALPITLFAPYLAGFISAADADAEKLVTVMRLYAWVLPFWTVVEVATAAVRATRNFGPEIKVRIFYEQGIRLVAAMAFAALGLFTYGLFLAHLLSVIAAAILALKLVAKHYNFRAIIKAPLQGETPKEILKYCYAIMPANLIKRLFSEFPVMFLNFMLPGAQGAAAGGYYSVARKIASALQAVRMTFEYVMAPLAAEKEGHGDRKALDSMYGYATRLSVTIALPFGAALILARHDILAAMRPEFEAATAAIAILCAGRVFEAATGPSSSIIEMLGHRLLPPANGMAGLIVMLALGFHLIPLYGVTGAAIAAACGLNTTAGLSLIQAKFLFGLTPYNRQMLRPMAAAILLSGILLALVPYSFQWQPPYGIVTALFLLLVGLVGIIRFGLAPEDAAALGKIGKRKKTKKTS
ncbi:lipopolysaccharide biosynthesis protein [Kordiimonas pumila]|uniref:Lipopolysaccharide biosynthesis protein n=1 Tax=Kordiimonas pumila TaxID=2161677 RepID=A0ABV7D2L7_9PROT|nr:polysaccharide biosynthesis C-terminal domain-containing protein [Kordiimonas pumila]